MDFVIDKKRLDGVIALLNNYVEKRDNSSINANVFLRANENGELLLRASDGEMGISFYLRDCEVKASGEIFASAKKLSDILRGLENANVRLNAAENKLKITQKKTRFTLPALSSGDFVFMDDSEVTSPLAISSSMLLNGLKMINNAIDSNSINLQFNCAHIQITPSEISFAGSDSKMISLYKIPGEFGQNEQLVLTKRAVAEILKLLADEVRVHKNADFLVIENDNFTFYCRTVNINLLPVSAVMPTKEPICAIELNTQIFEQEIKKLNAISDKCYMHFYPDEKVLFKDSPASDENSGGCSEISHQMRIDDEFSIYLNNRYSLDFLHTCAQDKFVLKYFAPGAPVVLEAQNYSALIACIKY